MGRRQAEDRREAQLYYFTSPQNLSREINRQSFYFSSPRAFNDPLDCDLTLLDDFVDAMPDANYRSFVERSVEELRRGKLEEGGRRANKSLYEGWTFGVGLRAADGSGYVEAYVEQHAGPLYPVLRMDPAAGRVALKAHLSSLIDGIGVKCFTRRWDNVLLWGHYARGYSGVCVGVYEPDQIIKGWNHNVGYSDIRYSSDKATLLHHASDLRSLIRVFMTTKFLEWQYEQESRIVTFRGSGYLDYRSSAIREIILGPNWFRAIPDETKDARKARFGMFFEALEKLRKYQQRNKKFRLYLCETDRATSTVKRHEVPDCRLCQFAKKAHGFTRTKEALDFVSA
jgi:hypothetical protein